MSLYIDKDLPAIELLKKENISVNEKIGNENCLKIVILNLMPTKIETETQLMRMLAMSKADIDIVLLQTFSYTSKNTSSEHLNKFYKFFNDIKDQKFDGMIITGAPVEHLEFKQVVYWEEICKIFEWAKTNVKSTYCICWAAQAALYYYYNIEKIGLEKKMFGIFEHETINKDHLFTKGFDEFFNAPHSRFAQVDIESVKKCEELDVLAYSEEAGLHIVSSNDKKLICISGHPEYDKETLSKEYFRDVEKGENIQLPKNYFPLDDPAQQPINTWRKHGIILFSNWVNYLGEK